MVLITTSVEAAKVRSLSREVKVEKDGENLIEVAVRCNGIKQARVITRIQGQDNWCFASNPDLCHSRKMRAARKVCSSASSVTKAPETDTTEVKTKPTPTPTPEKSTPVTNTPNVSQKAKVGPNGKTRAELMKEYIQIEEQRILVEQQKIELNKRELEIQKRELAL